MSQIDKLNFLPHLFWFFVLFGVFYFIVFSYILPLIYQSLELRSIFFNSLLSDSLSFNIFFHFFVHFYNTQIFEKTLKTFLFFLKQYKGINTVTFLSANKSFFSI